MYPQEDEGGAEGHGGSRDHVHSRSSRAVKTKASSLIVNSLITSTCAAASAERGGA